jgi:hypothetical protein
MRNVSIFVGHLREVKKGIAERAIAAPSEEEWTVNKIITRIVLYPLSLLLIFISSILIISGNLLGVAPLGFAFVYLYADLLIVTKKKRITDKW